MNIKQFQNKYPFLLDENPPDRLNFMTKEFVADLKNLLISLKPRHPGTRNTIFPGDLVLIATSSTYNKFAIGKVISSVLDFPGWDVRINGSSYYYDDSELLLLPTNR